MGVPRLRVVVMHYTQVPYTAIGCDKVVIYIAGKQLEIGHYEKVEGAEDAFLHFY